MAVSKQKGNVKIGVENEKVLRMQDNDHLKEFYYMECDVLRMLVTIFYSQVKNLFLVCIRANDILQN